MTGTPLQNNVMEYYHMITWARPEVLDPSSAAFEREFAIPIKKGMAKDSPVDEIRECDLKSTQLKKILEPYVNRKDSHVLRRDLPPMQQVVLHVRQSKMQTNLYKELRRHGKLRNNATKISKNIALCLN